VGSLLEYGKDADPTCFIAGKGMGERQPSRKQDIKYLQVLESMAHNSGIKVEVPDKRVANSKTGQYQTSAKNLHNKLAINDSNERNVGSLTRFDKNVVSAVALDQPLMSISSVVRCPQLVPEHPSVGLSPRRILEHSSLENHA
jgi:hypothetical protein